MADDLLTEEIDGAVGPIRVPITTVQALILLISRLLSTGNQLKSWMLMGTCARMTLEMGLHLDAQVFLRGNSQSKLHVLTRNDLYVRAKTFWAVWIFEQEMCSIFGRTGILRDIVITSPFVESIDTDWSRLEDIEWKYTKMDGLLADWDAEFEGCVPTRKGRLTPLWSLSRQIATVFAHSMRLIYYQIAMDSSRKPEQVQTALDKVMHRTRELVKTLPPMSILDGDSKVLKVDPAPPHKLIFLHLLLHSHIILMNRPFMTGSAFAENADNNPTLSAPSAGAAEDCPRSRCMQSAQTIVGLLHKWRSIFDDDLRTMCIAAAHILMSAGTIYLNEISSVISTKATNAAGASAPQTSKEAKQETRHVDDSHPLEHDYKGRREYGKKQLREGIYPLLQAMGKFRPAPIELLGRLKAAERERDDLVMHHSMHQEAQGNKAEEPQADSSRISGHSIDETNSTVSNQNLPELPGALSNFPPDQSGFALHVPGLADPNVALFSSDLPPLLWDPKYGDMLATTYPYASDNQHQQDDGSMDYAM